MWPSELTSAEKTFVLSCIANARETDDVSKMQLFRLPWGYAGPPIAGPETRMVVKVCRDMLCQLSLNIIYGKHAIIKKPYDYSYCTMSGFIEQMGRKPTVEDADDGWYLGHAPSQFFAVKELPPDICVDGRSWELACKCGLFKD